MKIAYFDCFSGISGDMILGAMVDAGLPIRALCEMLSKLELQGCTLRARRTRRSGLAGTKVDVINPNHLPPFDSFQKIKRHLTASPLPVAIKGRAIAIFDRLYAAEAHVHGRRDVHLHEVGEIDTIIDVVGAVAGLFLLKIDRVVASPIHVGAGTVKTAHGVFPVPAPATAILLTGCPIYSTGIQGELTTPTGAAIISSLAASFAPLPPMKIESIGMGAGDAKRERPNLLRLFVGEGIDACEEDEIVQIETNIDDMNPQIYEHVFDVLLTAGALDVFLTPIIMKRGRPAILLTVLAHTHQLETVTDVIFRETTTLGVRIHKMERRKLSRRLTKHKTPYGPVLVKEAIQKGRVIRKRPEFKEVQQLSKKEGRPLREVLDEIERLV